MKIMTFLNRGLNKTFFLYQPTIILRVLQTYFYPTLPRSSLQNKVHFLDKNIQSSSC